jgi:ribosome-associated protein YbcJ (S4-like RNA binding protein)
MNAETYFITLHEIQEKIAPVLNPGDTQVAQAKEEISDVMVRHDGQHESRWGDKVDQQDEKNVEIKSEKECN